MIEFKGRFKGPIIAAAHAAAALSLAACATHPAKPEATIINHDTTIPVAVKCASDPGSTPKFGDTPEALAAAPNILERAKLVMSARAERIAWEIRLAAANSACR